MVTQRLGLTLLGSGLMASQPGCLVVEERDPVPLATLTVEWTIDGRLAPVDCYDFAADQLELIVYDDFDRFVLETQPRCDDFGVSVDLREGLYTAEVTLVDVWDRPATLTEPIEDVVIVEGTNLVVDVDFPLGAFL
jgi:hypothetical protein